MTHPRSELGPPTDARHQAIAAANIGALPSASTSYYYVAEGSGFKIKHSGEKKLNLPYDHSQSQTRALQHTLFQNRHNA